MSANGFVWYELVTNDVPQALSFYGSVLGWTAQLHPGPQEYWVVSMDGKGVGGVMALPQGMPHPFWVGYIHVADTDEAVAKFTREGGTAHRVWDVPEVGRLAILSDPQGAGIALAHFVGDTPSAAFDQNKPGHGNWHELNTSDPEAAFTFYASQFGWVKDTAMDMGPMGTYQIFRCGEPQIGGMMRARDGMRPAWLYYFGVRDVPKAVEAIASAGGKVLHGPVEVPGGAHIVQAVDPQGAAFAVVGPGA